jgi:hypothetical protein
LLLLLMLQLHDAPFCGSCGPTCPPLSTAATSCCSTLPVARCCPAADAVAGTCCKRMTTSCWWSARRALSPLPAATRSDSVRSSVASTARPRVNYQLSLPARPSRDPLLFPVQRSFRDLMSTLVLPFSTAKRLLVIVLWAGCLTPDP